MNSVLSTVLRLKVIWACMLALLLGALLIAASGNDPLVAYAALFQGAFLDYWGIASTLVKMSPILLAGLAVAIPMRAGLFNIGAEGQIYMGALCGTVMALRLPEMPMPLTIALVILASAAGGAMWAAIPGYLKAYRGANEVIVTLLLNFVAIHLVSYAVSGPLLAEGASYPFSEEVPDEARLPIIMPDTDAHAGILIGLALVVMVHFFLTATRHGHAFDLVGRNPRAALYAGVAVNGNIVGAMMAGGALAGLAGGIEVIGLKYRLFHLFSPGYGFDGIVVAFMAGGQAAWIPLSALLLSGLKTGANVMQRAVGVEATVVEAIQGLIVIFVAASQNASLSFLRARFAAFRKRVTNEVELSTASAEKN